MRIISLGPTQYVIMKHDTVVACFSHKLIACIYVGFMEAEV